jgi:hypothetical protein
MWPLRAHRADDTPTSPPARIGEVRPYEATILQPALSFLREVNQHQWHFGQRAGEVVAEVRVAPKRRRPGITRLGAAVGAEGELEG